jgi:predicted metal-binding protein
LSVSGRNPFFVTGIFIPVNPQLLIDRVVNEGLMHIHIVEITDIMVIDHGVREKCALPYPGHPEGCPQYGKSEECPPLAPLVEDFIDLTKSHYFIIAEFTDISEDYQYIDQKESLQEKRRNRLLQDIMNRLQQVFPGTRYTVRPSALGIDVHDTVKALDIFMDPHPKKSQKRVVLLGYPHF